MRKIYCDRCGKEIKHVADVFNARILDITNHCQFIMAENDICGKCAKDIAEYAKRQPADEEKKKTENIDIGKIKALRSAGWSVDDIAAEMDLPGLKIMDILVKL